MTNASEDAPLTVLDDALALAPLPAEGMKPYTLIRSKQVRVVVLAFTAGHSMKEHSAPHPMLMQALDGEIVLRAADREIVLRPGTVVRLDASLRHEVEAVTDTRLMLTLMLG